MNDAPASASDRVPAPALESLPGAAALLDAIAARRREADALGGPIAVVSDYDGTITPIVETPEMARLDDDGRRALQRLARSPRFRVGLLTGRALRDLPPLLGFDPFAFDMRIAANHGLEIADARGVVRPAAAEASRARLDSFLEIVRPRLETIPGCRVEDKGVSLAFHFRGVAEDRRDEVVALVQRVRDEGAPPLPPWSDAFDVAFGKSVVELRPRVGLHKGTGARALLEAWGVPPRFALILGDDLTDEDAFKTFPDAITIRVVAQGDEGAERPTAAKFRLPDPDRVRELLEWLAADGAPGESPDSASPTPAPAP